MVINGYTGPLLDRYLANGWYRMGDRMFTCRYNYYPDGFLTTVWTRLPLKDHEFPKRVRKLIRRNGARFQVSIDLAKASPEEEEVFAKYSAIKSYDLHDFASDYLTNDVDDLFDTWQISVRDGDKLIAFSYFDIGEASMQSVCGFYDPAYEKFSLGLYTLVMEVAYAKTIGMSYHYSGYIVPGNDIFEYKRKVGQLEFFNDLNRVWTPINELNESELPSSLMYNAIAEYEALYKGLGLDFSLTLKPQYFIRISELSLQWLRREPLPFCITDTNSNKRPIWACHFYSFNYNRYFSMLCRQPQQLITVGKKKFIIEESLSTAGNLKAVRVGSAVRMVHSSRKPYTEKDLAYVWEQVEKANEDPSLHLEED